MHDEERHGEANFEQTDWHLKLVLFTGVVLAVGVLLSFAVGYGIMKTFDQRPAATEYRPSPLAAEQPRVSSALVRLQPNPALVYEDFKTRQERAVHAYGVISETPPIYRIPVETAMDLIAEHGFPEFVTASSTTTGADPEQSDAEVEE